MSLRQKITTLLLVCILVTPLIITPWSDDYYYYPKIYFVYIVTLTIWGLYCLDEKGEKIKKDFLELTLIGYIIICVLSTIFSIDRVRSIWGNFGREEGLFAIIAYCLLFIAAKRYYIFNQKHVEFMLIPSLAVAIYGILQYFGFDPIPRDFIRIYWKGRAFSTIGNPNFLGTYITLILPIFIFSYISSQKKRYMLGICITFFALLCTLTRSAWLGTLTAVFIQAWYVMRYKYNSKYFIITIGMLGFMALLFNFCSDGQLFDRFKSISEDAVQVVVKSSNYQNAGSNRVFIWERVLHLIKQRPILGYGLETLDIIFTKTYHDEIIASYGRLAIFDKAHNEFLNIAVSTGVTSLIFYITFILSAVYKAFKRVESNNLVIPLLCSTIGYLVQAFFNISVVSVAYLYWLLLGIMLNSSLSNN
jgi:O-antigen ligase